jgi:AraC-like DNA-binding protein
MKASLEQIIGKEQSSITITNLNREQFDGPYHYHPELELTWIKSSVGKRYIGSDVSDYTHDDLVLVGSNTPHCWRSTKENFGMRAKAIVIQFNIGFLGTAINEVPEFQQIKSLMETLNGGVIIIGKTKERTISKMRSLTRYKGFDRLVKFIEILDEISRSKETTAIDHFLAKTNHSTAENDRFQRIYTHIINNYQREMSLKEISDIANMTPPAFCRYFKNVARKTFTEVVLEFRINHACNLLKNTNLSISQVCFDSGFGNLSYFNKTFKAKVEYSPLQYKKLFSN